MRGLTIVLVVAALIACAGCGTRPEVVQGRVISYDDVANTVVVRNERAPHDEVVFALAGADIGALPAPGDDVRVAFRVIGAEKRALRMMNLTRQAELGRQGGGGH